MAAGHAVGGQGIGQHFRAGAGEQPFQAAIGQGRTDQGGTGKDRRTPLTCQQQQAGQQTTEEELGTKITHARDQYHAAIDDIAAMFLDQGHQALVEFMQIRPAEKQCGQSHQAEEGDDPGATTQAAQAAVDADPEQQRQACANQPGIQPEAFGERQAHRRASGPARQQVRNRPTGTGQQADGDKAWQGHVEHAGDHRQHRSQRADETTDQQAGDAVTLEIGLSAADPFRMVA
ncbi:hypothetical protein D3C77_473260 [compost metagenome]